MSNSKRISDDYSEKLEDAALAGGAAETVRRYGSAIKEHSVAYYGVDNEAGVRLTKGLKSISESKINPDFADSNIKQQAGFSAEVKSTARGNAENIIRGRSTRFRRTDDLGMVNDPLRDVVEVDASGRVIPGSGSQMKFVGGDPEALLDKLTSPKYQKYADNNVPFMVADDDYAALMGTNGNDGIIDRRIAELERQAKRTQESGNSSVAAQKRQEIAKLKQIKKDLKKAGLDRDEAIEARRNPELSTAKDIAGLAHRAGMEQAKYGGAIAGSIAMVTNLVAFLKGDKTFGEAVESTAAAAGTGAAMGYATGFAGATVKGLLQNSSSAFWRGISKTSLPAQMVSSAVSIGKTLHRYFHSDDMTAAQCMSEIAQDGVGTIGSVMCSTIGVAAIPAAAPAVVGVMVGVGAAMIGYTLATAAYKEIMSAMQEAKHAREQRMLIERECEESIRLIRKYRREMEEQVERYLSEHKRAFESCFMTLDDAILHDDIDGFIRGNAELQLILGGKSQFSSFDEFDRLMGSGEELVF
nr:hypothetical protein [Succinivibrionaceae bacterium]